MGTQFGVRADDGRTRDSMRGDAWRYGSGEAVRAKILKCSNNIISNVQRLVTTKLLLSELCDIIRRIYIFIRSKKSSKQENKQ